MKRPALFLDRDGVINIDHGYVCKRDDFEFLEGIFDLCRNAKTLGFLICVVTNQAGIGRGYYSEKDFFELTDWMCEVFNSEGSAIDKVYFCPTHPEHGIGEYRVNSSFRKPGPGMILQAIRELGIDIGRSVLIGDKETDIQAGIEAGIGCNLLYRSSVGDRSEASASTAAIFSLREAMPFLHATTPTLKQRRHMNKTQDVVWHHSTVTRERRAKLNGHKSVLVWFTGLSGSGKSTLAHGVEERLHQIGKRTFVLDGDNIRHGLCGDLEFSERDRVENIRRVGEVTKLFLEAGVITLTAFISPFKIDREWVRGLHPYGDFVEIYCRCPLDVCEARDVKGLYKRARNGEIMNFTGISSRYEEPLAPELIIDTNLSSLDESIESVMTILQNRGVIGFNRIQNELARG